MAQQQFETIDDYIASFPHDVQVVLEGLRCEIRAAAPNADESVSYHMPTFSVGGAHLVFFAAWKTHVALYAIPPLDDELEAQVAPFRAAKDTVKFPLRKPVPYNLVGQIVTELAARRVEA